VGNNQSSVKSGFAISILVAVGSWLTGSNSTPIINPDWVKNVQNLLANIPIVGPYVTVVPVDLFTMVLSIVAAWGMASLLIGKFMGFKGIILAAVFGSLIVFMLTGMSIFDLWTNIVTQLAGAQQVTA